MNLFLQEFNKKYGSKKVAMVMDGAAWHKSKDLYIADNLQIIIQPPYSPELNPVEKLWQYIKSRTIRNKVFEQLDVLENTIAEFIKNITPFDIKNICNVRYI